MRNILVLLLATFSLGCAIGPLVSHETARTVGDSNHELVGGYGHAGILFKWNYGLSENWDLGFHLESLSMGVRTKYAFINNSSGWSAATAFGTGASLGGSYVNLDFMGSYVTGAWEPYGTLRLVRASFESTEFSDAETGDIIFTVPVSSYDYGQFIVGTRYWFSQNWLLSLEGSSLFSTTKGVNFNSNTLFSLGLGYRF